MKNMKKTHFIALALVLVICATFFSFSQTVFAVGENCTPYATKQCISNISYWHNSCGALQSIYQNCNTTNQLCQSGQCVDKPTPPPAPVTSHARTACYNNNIYWYNSQGGLQEMQKSCSDTNTCTVDSCSQNKCSNTLKCDGSTCAVNSADYNQHCSANPTPTPTPTTPGGSQTQANNLVISVFAKKETDGMQWQKYVTATNNDRLNFLITVKNISTQPINGVSVSIDSNAAIVYLGDLKIDNLASQGNINSGVAVGTISPKTSLAITFSATLQSPNAQVFQINGRVSTENTTLDTDILSINATASSTPAMGTPQTLTPNQDNLAGVTASDAPVVAFVKKWYLWIVIIAVLIVLFIIIFRRLSTNP